jgi:hypothetical protein
VVWEGQALCSSGLEGQALYSFGLEGQALCSFGLRALKGWGRGLLCLRCQILQCTGHRWELHVKEELWGALRATENRMQHSYAWSGLLELAAKSSVQNHLCSLCSVLAGPVLLAGNVK